MKIFIFLSLISFIRISLGNFINVADKNYGSQCTSAKPFRDVPPFDFKCENVLDSDWTNNKKFLTECLPNLSSCENSFIKIIFDKTYDIYEFGIQQPFTRIQQYIKSMIVETSHSHFHHYAVEQTSIQYFLFTSNMSFGINWMNFKLLDTYGSKKRGFNSIIAYAYKNG